MRRNAEHSFCFFALVGSLLCSCNWSSDIVAGVLSSGGSPHPSDAGHPEAGRDAMPPEAGPPPEDGKSPEEAGHLEAGRDAMPLEAGRDASPLRDATDDGEAGDVGVPEASFDSGLPPVTCELDASFIPRAPIHRYRFSGSGSTVVDTIGGADGTIEGTKTTTLDNSGVYVLNRTHADSERNYVNLPNRLISNLTDATFMVWFDWYGGAAYQRVFDFGMGGDGEDPPLNHPNGGTSYFALSPVFDQGHLVAILKTPSTGGEITIPDEANITDCPIAGGCTTEIGRHFVTVVVQSGKQIDVYWDGPAGREFSHWGTRATAGSLSEVDDRNDWLGRSQYNNDWFLWGAYDELRIYDQALPSCAIERAYHSGPNSLAL